MSNHAYELVRSLVNRLGGAMEYNRKGYRHGAWVIKVGVNSIIIKAEGNQSFSELDRLYVPRVPEPRHWDDFSNELVPDAEAKLLSMLGVVDEHPEIFPDKEAGALSLLVERTKWKFAWTYARTFPHEYTTKGICNPDDHARLIYCIERFGRIERFGDSHRKYFYFEERKYWHMGDPRSGNPEDWPNVINRSWVEVRRHAENVRHVWSAEEVELQMRLWEIRLKKATD